MQNTIMIAAQFRDREPVPFTLRYLPPGAAAVLALQQGGCRWPLGDVEHETFRFCAEARVNRSYCATHARHAGRRQS